MDSDQTLDLDAGTIRPPYCDGPLNVRTAELRLRPELRPQPEPSAAARTFGNLLATLLGGAIVLLAVSVLVGLGALLRFLVIWGFGG